MWKNRVACILFTAVLAVLLFFYYKPLFAGALCLMVLVVILMTVCTHVDAGHINPLVHVRMGGRKGRDLAVVIEIRNSKKLLAARNVCLNLNVYNCMFDMRETYQLNCVLGNGKNKFEMKIPMQQCGKLRIHCENAWVCDMLGMIRWHIKPFEDAYTVIYPKPVNMALEMSKNITGSAIEGGMVQNRKGNDSSEMYDIREYTPGDDIRAIHWKLSSKTDELILRQASNPAHYDVALLPDFGLDVSDQNSEAIVSEAELSMAADVCAQIAEKLIENHTSFCMLIPTKQGLESFEVRSTGDLERMLAQWLCFRIQEKSGAGLQYFQTNHMEQSFSRLMIVSAGRYKEALNGLDRRIGISLIHIVSDIKKQQVELAGNCEITELPLVQDSMETCRIVY